LVFVKVGDDTSEDGRGARSAINRRDTTSGDDEALMSDGRHIWVSTSTGVEVGLNWHLCARAEVVRDLLGLEVGYFVEVAEPTTGSPLGVLISCGDFLSSTCALVVLAQLGFPLFWAAACVLDDECAADGCDPLRG